MAAAVVRGVQVLVAGSARYPAILPVGEANGSVAAATVDFLNPFPCVAPICGRQQNSFTTPVRDRRLNVHPAVSGIQEKNFACGSPPDAFRQGIEVLDCPARATIRG